MPPMSYGYCHHVMDFPGTINVRQPLRQSPDRIGVLSPITGSSGSVRQRPRLNHPAGRAGRRQTNLQTDALCTTLSWWQLAADRWNAGVRANPGPAAAPTPASWKPRCILPRQRSRRAQGADRQGRHRRLYDGHPGWHWSGNRSISPSARGRPPSRMDLHLHGNRLIGAPELAPASRASWSSTTRSIAWPRCALGADAPTLPRVDHHATPPTFELPFVF